jgi:hypothetical protein
VALVFAVTLTGTPAVQPDGEASDFRWCRRDLLDGRADLWPGTLSTVDGALSAG